MRIYYLDDSGSRVKGNGKYFVLGGFGVDADKVPEMARTVKARVKGHGFDMAHPSELKFNQVGRTSDKRPNDPHWMLRAGIVELADKKALVQNAMGAALESDSAEALAVVVNHHDYHYSDSKEIVRKALSVLLERVHMGMRIGESALVVMDEERTADKDLRSTLRAGTDFMKFHSLIDTISFMPSEDSPGIQIADLIAGSVFRYFEHDDPSNMRVIWKHFRSGPGGEINRYGIKVFPFGKAEPPPARVAPWKEIDRDVHAARFKGMGQEVEWNASGRPNKVFLGDSDTFQ